MTNNSSRIPEDLRGPERDLFAHYMLGATSAHIPEDIWQRLYEDAHKYCLNLRQIKEATKQSQPVSQNAHS